VEKDGSKLVSKIGKTAYFEAFMKLNKGSGSAYRIRNSSYSLVPVFILKVKGIGVTLHMPSTSWLSMTVKVALTHRISGSI
jgi:hypothetical protein